MFCCTTERDQLDRLHVPLHRSTHHYDRRNLQYVDSCFHSDEALINYYTSDIFSVGYTGAYEHLVPRRPSGSLLGPSTIFSIIIHIAFVILFQSVAYVYLTEQPW